MMGKCLVIQESLFYTFWPEGDVTSDQLLRRIDRRQGLAGWMIIWAGTDFSELARLAIVKGRY